MRPEHLPDNWTTPLILTGIASIPLFVFGRGLISGLIMICLILGYFLTQLKHH